MFWISQGARRIVSEWPDLDLEARGFTAKFLGDEVELQEPSPNQSQTSTSKTFSEVDLESKAESSSKVDLESKEESSSEVDLETKAELWI